MIKLIDILKEVKIVRPIQNNIKKLEQIKDEIDQTEDESILKALAIKASELVLPFWNRYYPGDERMEQAIEAAKRGERDNSIGDIIVTTDDKENWNAADYVIYSVHYATMNFNNNIDLNENISLSIRSAIDATKEYFKID